MKTLLGTAAAVIGLLSATTAHSQFVTNCVTFAGPAALPCSSFAQQLLDYARQAEQLIQEVTTAEQEVINTINLPVQLYHDITAPIQQVVALAQQADLLLGHTGDFINNLNAGYYPLPTNAIQQIIYEQNSIGNAIQQLGNIIGVTNTQLPDRATVIAAIQSESLGDAGRLQALQHAQQLAATTAQDMHSLVNLNVAMAQGQHAELLAKHDRQAMEDAMMDQFSTTYQPFQTDGWKGF